MKPTFAAITLLSLMIGAAAPALSRAADQLPAGADAVSLPTSPINPSRLSDHVKVLSSDAFEGRGPATRAEVKTIKYIEGQFKALGLKPGGDLLPSGQRGWTQNAPLRRFEVSSEPKLAFNGSDGARTLQHREDVVVHTLLPVKQVQIDKAPLVFVGYGVKAPERGWDDFKGVDLKGKIAVVLINDPDFETPTDHPTTGKFGGKAMTYYGRWTYKYEEAARQGALGMLIVHELSLIHI